VAIGSVLRCFRGAAKGRRGARRGVVAAADGGMAATGARCCDGSRVAADRVRNGREFGEGSTRFFILLIVTAKVK
jgi:hypothetical protein